MFTWHITFQDQAAVLDLAATVRGRLAGLPGLDLVPGQWLHLTTQGVGFTDEVNDEDLAAITRRARTRLATVRAPLITIGPARVASEGISCEVRPHGALTPLRDALRAAIADVWGPERVPEASEWTPHVSVAYSNATGPAGAFEAALDGEDATAVMAADAVQLIRLGRDRRVYEWETCASVPLADGAARTGLCSASRVPTRTPRRSTIGGASSYERCRHRELVVATIYHITSPADWEQGRQAGEYTTSTRGKTLAEVGFLHPSTATQVLPVAGFIHLDDPDEPLVVLVIDTGKLASPIKHDQVPGWTEPFPHIYGPLNADAVVQVIPLEPGPDGELSITLPAGE
jgi:uncharacterized protein (DUF952 family)/2'-5' RNA ligase